jgi:hypothetical protein
MTTHDAKPGGLEGLTSAARAATAERKLPPVHLWNPDYCGEIDMRIARDGVWFYNGSPIGRLAAGAIVLDHPAQGSRALCAGDAGRARRHSVVEDAPFLAVEMRRSEGPEGQILAFRTNVEDWVEAGPDHPMRFEPGDSEGLKPYVHIRADLWALVKRALFYDLVEAGEMREVEGGRMFGVVSRGAFFAMAPAEDIERYA